MLKLASLFGDFMVLQQGKRLPVWGTACPYCKITVTLQSQTVSVFADEKGVWKAWFDPLNCSFCETLTVTAEGETLTYHDVQVGEVWLAGGQSNMEFPMAFDQNLAEELLSCQDDALRFFDVPKISYPGQEQEADYTLYGFWRKACPEQLARFSAVGYYFAKELRHRYHVPVGVIGCNWGGTPACAWMSEAAILAGEGKSLLEEYASRAPQNAASLAAYDLQFRANPGNYRTDLLEDFRTSLMLQGKSLAEIMEEQSRRGLSYTWSAPVWGPKYERRPGGLYHSMLQPLAPFGLRGILWYQGETDGDTHPELYASLFPSLISDWRKLWAETLPFLFVQIAPLEQWMQCSGAPYGTIRAAQQHTAETVPNTAMAVITDAGMQWDIHPKAKRVVGQRLSLLAAHYVYNEEVCCEAPTLLSAEITEGLLRLNFCNAGKGLHLCHTTPHGDTLIPHRLYGVRILQASRRLDSTLCTVQLHQNQVVLKHPSLQAVPTRVEIAQGGWYQMNLYNSSGIPARPAITEALPFPC